jgi:hypothetical protein
MSFTNNLRSSENLSFVSNALGYCLGDELIKLCFEGIKLILSGKILKGGHKMDHL